MPYRKEKRMDVLVNVSLKMLDFCEPDDAADFANFINGLRATVAEQLSYSLPGTKLIRVLPEEVPVMVSELLTYPTDKRGNQLVVIQIDAQNFADRSSRSAQIVRNVLARAESQMPNTKFTVFLRLGSMESATTITSDPAMKNVA